jgi:hypothetical protein
MFLDLPESIHTAVARFIRVKQALRMTATCSRLALPEASQAWYGSERLHLNFPSNLQTGALITLLRRLQGLTKFDANFTETIHPLAIAITSGLCKNLRMLHLGGQVFLVEGGRVASEVPLLAFGLPRRGDRNGLNACTART